MTLFDYLIVTLLAGAALLGAMRGLVTEVFALLGLAGTGYVAAFYGPSIAQLLSGALASETERLTLAYIGLFISVRLAAVWPAAESRGAAARSDMRMCMPPLHGVIQDRIPILAHF